ncbi:serine/threonine-protein kinase [Microbacterium enclense]|uniref:Serine/threonine-protein kinase n=1 Tax=Microbacterium enclense TaxID=993073 RepID=A0A443JKF8_9MICO|nr:serine/threonine-protein kinase [Microbacterium enclense]RWR21011.1 serine/threonine-protein kinase [Microbacterium enclense]
MSEGGDATHPAPSTVAERFQIRGLLGAGATASVYEARDLFTGEDVALKVLHPHLASEVALAHAFLREAEVVAGVTHPGLCALRAFGDGRTPDRTWTAWELVRGASLSETVRTSGRLDVLAAATAVGQLLDALAALHAVGVVHRDISPANVLMTPGPEGVVRDVRLVDFGLAAPIGESARGADVLRSAEGDGVVGNASYASPEQLRGEPVGVAGDIYQVAGVLYFALVGTPPFPRARTADVVEAHLTALPPTASVTVPGIPVALDRVIVRGLLKDPSERFPDAAAMRAAVDEVARAREPRAAAAVAPAVAPTPRPVVAPTRVLAPAAAATAIDDVEERRTSPWLWVLAAAAVAMILAVVAVAARPAVSEPGSSSTDAPVAEATTPASDPPSATPTPTATSAVPSPTAPALVRTPDVQGLSLPDAADALRRAGLEVGERTNQDGTAVAQTVVAGSPAAGTEVSVGSRVDLVIATGWNAVPDLAGFAEEDAIGRITGSGLIPIVVREQRPGISGAVAAVEPAASTRLPLGSTVTLIVATAPTPTPSAPASATPSPNPSA